MGGLPRCLSPSLYSVIHWSVPFLRENLARTFWERFAFLGEFIGIGSVNRQAINDLLREKFI